MEVAQHPIQYQLSSAPPASGVPVCLDFPSAPTFFIAKTQQQPFKLINCLLLIAPDRLEDDTGALKRACNRVNVAFLRIGGVVLHSWISFAITALIERKAVKRPPPDASGVASEGSSLVRQDVSRPDSKCRSISEHNGASNASPCPSGKRRRAVMLPSLPCESL
jgi:hypothetical protein